MKIVFVFLCTLFTCSSFAQEEYNRVLFSQLMVIFSDLENHFDYLKGDLKTKEGSVAFYETNRTLNGTKDNMIAIDSSTSQYVAIVNDSTSEENSKHILALWKEKLMNALTGMFTAPSEFYSKKDAGTNGYQFTSDKIVLYLLRHKTENGWYWINIIIRAT